MARGLDRRTKHTEKNILFTQLGVVHEWSSYLKCAGPQHRCQAATIKDPGGACYNCGRKEVRHHLPFLPVAPQSHRRGHVGKKEWGRVKPSCHHHHAPEGMKGTPRDGKASPKPEAAFQSYPQVWGEARSCPWCSFFTTPKLMGSGKHMNLETLW